MTRRACLAIGVGEITPPSNQALTFPYLDGAVVAARSIGTWALRSGFGDSNVRVVHDGRSEDGKANPVTRDRVQQAVNELFYPGAERVQQLVLFFCGHGLTDSTQNSISWLFSDSLENKYRVVADRFYTELLLHGIERITLITDACREAPKDLDLMRLDAVRGIVVQGAQVASPKFDRFAACQDGKQGFMVSDPTSAAPGKCIFFGVIADALWGQEPTAIENGRVTTATLGICVEERAKSRANDYFLKLNPECLVHPQPALFFDAATPPGGPPDLQPWPPVLNKQGVSMGTGATQPEELEVSAVKFSRRRRSRTTDSADALELKSLDIYFDEVFIAKGPGRNLPRMGLSDPLAHEWLTSGGLVVSAPDAAVWSGAPLTMFATAQNGSAYKLSDGKVGQPLLVRVEKNRFVHVVPYADISTLVGLDKSGEIFLAYGLGPWDSAYKRTVNALQEFAAGRIGVSHVDRLTAAIRRNKHRDPMLGVLAAYLYRATADLDSIRRMAYFYVQHEQPVPFDIALLGDMAVTKRSDGVLEVSIPEVLRRPDADSIKLPDFTVRATPAAVGTVGGRCPWMGLGWDHVYEPRAEWAALVEGLAEIAPNVPRSGCTTLDADSALKLIGRWGLKAG